MKPKTLFSYGTLSLVLILVLSLPSPTFSFCCNQEDYKVLLKIKVALGNPYIFISWKEGTKCCNWNSHDCDHKTNQVNKLDISYDNISGQILPDIANLPYLVDLTIRKLTNLTGEIPEAISKFTNLKYLTLSWTNLTGPILLSLSKLRNLATIDLSFNNLTGSIPSPLSKLLNLYGINLSRNNLTGTIPDSFGKFGHTLQYIFLKKNLLSGPIPKSIENLNVRELYFSRNNLTGDFVKGAKIYY